MATELHMNALVQRLLGMTAADVSVLEAAITRPGIKLTTIPGSRRMAWGVR